MLKNGYTDWVNLKKYRLEFDINMVFRVATTYQIQQLVVSLCIQPNFGFNCDKYPADYCVIFYGSEVISVFNFVVGTCALSG